MYRIPPGASDDIAGEQSRDPIDDRDSGRQVEVIAIGPSAIVTGTVANGIVTGWPKDFRIEKAKTKNPA